MEKVKVTSWLSKTGCGGHYKALCKTVIDLKLLTMGAWCPNYLEMCGKSSKLWKSPNQVFSLYFNLIVD